MLNMKDFQQKFYWLLTLILALSWLPCIQAAYQIETFAGTGIPGYSGDGGLAMEAQIHHVRGLAVDRSGNLYIADVENHRVRKVDIITGIITTVAGGGNSGLGDGGNGKKAQLNMPIGVTVDDTGNLYILDFANYRVRKVDTNGMITTVVGNGIAGYSGDGESAEKAQINPVWGDVTVDSKGNLYIADRFNHCIRKVDSKSIITTIAGNGTQGYNGDGGIATDAQLNLPEDMTVDGDGNLYIADSYNHVIRKINTNGIITTIVGNGKQGYDGDNNPATEAELNLPVGVALDSLGNLYVTDFNNHRIRKVDQNGIITTIAGNGKKTYSGDGELATTASFDNPEHVALDINGTGTVLYVNDKHNFRIRKLEWTAIDTAIRLNLFLLSGLGILLSIAIYYVYLYRNPVVQTLSITPSQLLSTPLEQLPKSKRLLKRTHRLDTILANNDVPLLWLDKAIKFSTMSNGERCALLAKKLSARLQTGDDTGVFLLQLGKTFPLNLTNCLVYFPPVDLPAAEIIQLNQEKMSSQVTVVISLVPTQQAALRPEGENLANLWVVPNSRELTELLLSPQPINVFARLLASQLAVTTVSPYKTGGSIEKDSTFFGREKTLVQIINRELRNYLLIGGRKLGKSSLLKKIKRHYQNHPKVKCFYLSLNDDSLRKLNVTLGLAKNTTLFALLDKLTEVPTGKQYLILIDEADQFIRREIAEGYPTLNKFRSISEEGYCHFILAGFWNLYEAAVLDYHSPIGNFGESIIVGELERKACQQLITEPMALLGIHYAEKDLVAQIITATGQRANLVATVCDEMLKNLPSEQRILNAEDVAKALHSKAIQQTLAGWRQLSDDKQSASLDRIIVYATIEAGEFTLTNVMTVLNAHEYVYTTEQLNQSLERLELAYIIRHDKNHYSYCVPLFREMLLESEAGTLLEQEFKQA